MPKGDNNVERPPIIPHSVREGMQRPEGKKTIKEMQEEGGGAGVWSFPYQEHYQLDDDSWKYDNRPEFFEGKNVADFYDPEIEQKLDELEKEEAYLVEMEKNEIVASDSDEELMIEAWKKVKLSVKQKRDQ